MVDYADVDVLATVPSAIMVMVVADF